MSRNVNILSFLHFSNFVQLYLVQVHFGLFSVFLKFSKSVQSNQSLSFSSLVWVIVVYNCSSEFSFNLSFKLSWELFFPDRSIPEEVKISFFLIINLNLESFHSIRQLQILLGKHFKIRNFYRFDDTGGSGSEVYNLRHIVCTERWVGAETGAFI